MALTKDERRALELARENIRNGARWGICHQIDRAEELRIISAAEAERLLTYIGDALDPMRHIEWWDVRWLGKWQEKNLLGHRSEDQLRADRLAWIDWMLGKPLPGEAVKLEWSSRSLCKDEAEYCGRTFVCYYAYGRLFVHETTEGRNKYIGEFTSIEQADAAIVAHVWPAS